MLDANGLRYLKEQLENAWGDEQKIDLLCEAVIELLEREVIGATSLSDRLEEHGFEPHGHPVIIPTAFDSDADG